MAVNDTHLCILNMIPCGHANAIKRRELAGRLGLMDRTLRRVIEDLRNSGEIICNFQDGQGYFRPESISDVYAQYKIDKSRMESISAHQKPLEKRLKEAGVEVC